MKEEKKEESFLKSTLKLSFGIFINKPIGFLRDILQMKYFGLSLLGDAYVIGWRIPNVLRRIFCEGLMTSVLLPYLIKLEQEETKETLNKTITMIVCIMQSIITIICFCIAIYSTKIITLLSPGAIERIYYGSQMLKILIFFTFFASFSSVLGVTVQLYKKFYLGSLAQFFLNIFFCIELFCSSFFNLSYLTLCTMISANGIIIVLVHLWAFYKYHFYFIFPDWYAFRLSLFFLKKFFIALLSSVLLEINMFAGLSLTSYLTTGSLSLFEYINTLIRFPLQIIGSALATTSSVEISQLIYQNKQIELTNRLYEFFKLFFIVSVFLTLGIILFSHSFFTIFFHITGIAEKHIITGAHLLFIMNILIFPSLVNKILLNVFYAFHQVTIPTIITFITSIINNIVIWQYINTQGLYILALSNVLFEWVRLIIFMLFLKYRYSIQFSNEHQKKEFFSICWIFIQSLLLLFGISFLITYLLSVSTKYLYIKDICLIAIYMIFLYKTYTVLHKKKIKIKI